MNMQGLGKEKLQASLKFDQFKKNYLYSTINTFYNHYDYFLIKGKIIELTKNDNQELFFWYNVLNKLELSTNN